jgi:hypothetical protein
MWRQGVPSRSNDERFSLLKRLQYAYTLFRNQQEVFNKQVAWHSPNTLPTMVYGEAFCIITWQPPLNTINLNQTFNFILFAMILDQSVPVGYS